MEEARGAQACTRAWITPGNPVAPSGCVPSPAGYDGSDIEVENTNCVGLQRSEPVFVIRNVGRAMSAARQYRVYFDSLLVYAHAFQLGAGDSLVIIVPRTLQQFLDQVSVRLEAEQDPHHPYSTTASSLDYCFVTRTGGGPGKRSGEGGYFGPDDESPVVDTDCQPIRDSYDPNDKQVSPLGIGSPGNVRPGTMLDYTIRFQNTGTDTAYTVRIQDTLSADLDLTTLELGASSHPYRFSVSGKGRPALRFEFRQINLVDSITSEQKSHGFVSFRIRPRKEAAIGTRIENRASIYFDFNDPVATNTTLNTIHVPSVVPGLIDSVRIVAANPLALAPNVQVVPNPSKGLFTLALTGPGAGSGPVSAHIQTLDGRTLKAIPVLTTRTEVDLQGYPKGVYLLSVLSRNKRDILKVVVE